MKPAPFDLTIADSLDEALAVLAEYGEDAQVLAGGQSLVAMLNLRLAKPSVLIDINRLTGTDKIDLVGGTVRIGATVRQRAIECRVETKDDLPLLAQALPHVGHAQTRARGTVCGSICHADPSAELPLCLLALQGEVELMSRRGHRTLPAATFSKGLLSTAREPDEIVLAAHYPAAKTGYGYAFSEVAERHGDFALASFAAAAGPDFTRLAIGGLADRPVARTWQTTNLDDIAGVLNDFAWDLGGVEDHHATAHYRRDQVRHQGLRTIAAALGACRSQSEAVGT